MADPATVNMLQSVQKLVGSSNWSAWLLEFETVMSALGLGALFTEDELDAT